MNVACPSCSTVYRIDPARVPAGGALTRCRECSSRFRIEPDSARAPGEVTTGTTATTAPSAERSAPPGAAPGREAGSRAAGAAVEPAEAPSAPTGGGGSDEPTARPAFGPQDPQTRARRLARALVSDIKVYNPEKWEESRSSGTLRKTFREEILKSWEEYVEQVGEELAKRTPYFRDALNDILAGGERVF